MLYVNLHIYEHFSKNMQKLIFKIKPIYCHDANLIELSSWCTCINPFWFTIDNLIQHLILLTGKADIILMSVFEHICQCCVIQAV